MLLPSTLNTQCKTLMPEDANSGMTADDHLVISSHFTDTETDAQIIVKRLVRVRPRLLALDTGFCHCPE